MHGGGRASDHFSSAFAHCRLAGFYG
jgi:hypothetical protein